MIRTHVLALFVLVVLVKPGYAGDGFYLDVGAGATFFFPTVYDGTWKQEGTSPPNFRLADLAWRAGVGYRFNERWSVQAHYLDMGTAKVKARAVDDRDYDPVNHICLRNCSKAVYFLVVDQMRGFDLSVTRSFGDGAVQPFIRLGGALMFHRLTSKGDRSESSGHLYGRIPMVLGGVGACYKERWCLDSTFYSGFMGMDNGCLGGECGFPIAKQALVTMVSFQFN